MQQESLCFRSCTSVCVNPHVYSLFIVHGWFPIQQTLHFFSSQGEIHVLLMMLGHKSILTVTLYGHARPKGTVLSIILLENGFNVDVDVYESAEFFS